jgi:hypothetical protein
MLNSLGQKLYTLADVARAAGVDYSSVFVKVRYSKTLPEPDVALGHRSYYSEPKYHEVVAECQARKSGGHDAE